MFEDNKHFNAMEQVEKIEFVRELKNKLTKFEEQLIKGLARNEGQMEIEYVD
mgnify:FL=1